MGPVLPFFDEAVYGTEALDLRDAMTHPDLAKLLMLLADPRLHPPLVPLTAVPLTGLLASAPLAIRLTHWLWVVGLCLSVLLLGQRLSLGAASMALSLVFLLASPVLLSRAWIFGTDVPLACVVVLSLWYLTRRPFASWSGAIGLGFLAGTGLLVKESFPLFVAFPALLEFVREATVAVRDRGLAGVTGRAAVAAGMASLVAGVWYVPNMGWLAAWVPGAYRSAGSARIFGTSQVLTATELADWLFRAFWSEGIAPWVTLFALFGGSFLLSGWRSLVHRWGWILLGSAGFPALAIWLTSTSKSVRYLLPVLVIVCLVAGLAVRRVWAFRLVGHVAVVAATAISLLLAVGTYWGDWLFPGYRPGSTARIVQRLIAVKVDSPWERGGVPGDWHAVDALEAIVKDAVTRGVEKADVVVASRYPTVSDNAYRFVTTWKNLPLVVGATSLGGWLPLAKQVRDSDYVVAKVGGTQGELDGALEFPMLWRFLAEGFSHTPVASFPLPDGSRLVVLRRDARWYFGDNGNAVYRIYEALGDARILRSPGGLDLAEALRGVSGVDLGRRQEAGLFQHPPSKVSFSLLLPLRTGIEFRTGLGLLPGAVGRSDGVRFKVNITHGDEDQVLVDRVVATSTSTAAMERFDLSRYAGSRIDLILETDPGPSSDPRYDWAVWVGPAIYTTDR
jgi:hypothetical protein